MNKYLIDGHFLSSMSTGIDRYAFQILRELDRICEDLTIAILVPKDAKEVPQYKNITVIQSNQYRHWTQVVFGMYARIHGYIPVNLCNEVSVLARKGIVCLHDVCYAESEEFYPMVNEFPQEERAWFLQIYRRIAKRAKKIITVSEFSKCRIEELLGIESDRIEVIGNGWQHFDKVQTDDTLLTQYPGIEPKKYYFTMTSANKNKNAQWVMECSRANPEETFVIAGKGLDRTIDFHKYPNVIYVGFASDVLAKTLMKHCRAFIFPSFYEGFGIPPLEALSTGAQVIVSDVASLPEIFQGAAHYISPEDPYVNLKELMQEPVHGAEQVLAQYSWANSAQKLYTLLKTFS